MALPLLCVARARLDRHPRWSQLYPRYLQCLHWMVRACVPLMETALERARVLADDDDDDAARLAEYLRAHVPEEVGHDEWLLEDLRATGANPEPFLRHPPPATVAALVGSQYYWVLHFHPLALLGYVFVLERYAPTSGQVDEYISQTGHPASAFRTLREHAVLDRGHGADLAEVLDSMTLSHAHLSLLTTSALTTVELFARALGEVVDEFDNVAPAPGTDLRNAPREPAPVAPTYGG
jgi:hypothetical protein